MTGRVAAARACSNRDLPGWSFSRGSRSLSRGSRQRVCSSCRRPPGKGDRMPPRRASTAASRIASRTGSLRIVPWTGFSGADTWLRGAWPGRRTADPLSGLFSSASAARRTAAPRGSRVSSARGSGDAGPCSKPQVCSSESCSTRDPRSAIEGKQIPLGVNLTAPISALSARPPSLPDCSPTSAIMCHSRTH